MLGRSLGNYQVVSKIGEGGMGIVYLARHATLGRPAAVKVLHPEMSSNQDIVARFFNEARAATAVRHSGIVEVFDFGFLEDRTAYIVMEYLDGESLAARMRRARSPIAATLTIVRAIARSLQAAHEHGIVHRDLKPDNVFLVPDPELPSGERVKLLDFGIAKLAVVGEASHTRTGTVMGTPTYMAPEQCRGAGSVDHRADLYALGCVAYEMLCGQPPFVADGPGDVIARHLYFQPSPLRSHRPDIPAELDDLVLWLLQKDPGARPATATDFVRAVDRLLAVTSPALRTEPMVTNVNANWPVVTETTLSGAAAASAVPRTPTSARRVRFIAGAAAATIGLIVIIVLARAGHDGGEPRPTTEPTAVVGGPKAPELPAPLPVAVEPPPAAPLPAPAIGSATTPTSPETPKPETPPEVAKRPVADAPGVAPRSAEIAKPPAKRAEVAKSGDAPRAPATIKPADAAACTRAAFAAVLNAPAPDEAAVQGALGRLGRCKPTMKPELFADIQRQLVATL
jgi:serine/threonine-protein kinase